MKGAPYVLCERACVEARAMSTLVRGLRGNVCMLGHGIAAEQCYLGVNKAWTWEDYGLQRVMG